jgi:hypothetical protein
MSYEPPTSTTFHNLQVHAIQGTPVCMYQSDVPIFFQIDDDEYDELLATGEWKAPTCLAKFRAALKAVHRLYPHLRTGYYPVCPECVRANQE